MNVQTFQPNGGMFYDRHNDTENTVFIDPRIDRPGPDTQQLIRKQLKQNETLRALDFRYAVLVAGASKMPMSMVWVSKNKEGGFSNTDRAIYKNMAWNTFVRNRFLENQQDGDNDSDKNETRPIFSDINDEVKAKQGKGIGEISQSMLQIVEKMNLEWVQFQLMGLHEQVEASELNLVIQLCQAGIIPGVTKNHSVIVHKLRRMDLFYEVFALAVGGYVCASAPYTMGSATTRYERDLQFKYKRENTNMLAILLQQNMHALFQNDELGIDYIEDVSNLSAVRRRVADAKLESQYDGPPVPPSAPSKSGRLSKSGDGERKRRKGDSTDDTGGKRDGDDEVKNNDDIAIRLLGGSMENMELKVGRIESQVLQLQKGMNERIVGAENEMKAMAGGVEKQVNELSGLCQTIKNQCDDVRASTYAFGNSIPGLVFNGITTAFSIQSGGKQNADTQGVIDGFVRNIVKDKYAEVEKKIEDIRRSLKQYDEKYKTMFDDLGFEDDGKLYLILPDLKKIHGIRDIIKWLAEELATQKVLQDTMHGRFSDDFQEYTNIINTMVDEFKKQTNSTIDNLTKTIHESSAANGAVSQQSYNDLQTKYLENHTALIALQQSTTQHYQELKAETKACDLTLLQLPGIIAQMSVYQQKLDHQQNVLDNQQKTIEQQQRIVDHQQRTINEQQETLNTQQKALIDYQQRLEQIQPMQQDSKSDIDTTIDYNTIDQHITNELSTILTQPDNPVTQRLFNAVSQYLRHNIPTTGEPAVSFEEFCMRPPMSSAHVFTAPATGQAAVDGLKMEDVDSGLP